ncbi:hypothetical protein U5922_013855 [Aquicoccus sp. G2-2]|uniref:hypothetical protein n=1 Tax=Aquicoccus sp. G2-2 TaxID=3092120 RepID=UPI002AE0173F|nr:hypothetical protein [Aquicoccus sp. G2-2]MEA1114489.1 hypothetical protein [Aquicoccus sp. G2-2]
MLRNLQFALCFSLISGAAQASAPEVVAATAHRVGMGWRIDVTLKHPDTGWDHYADSWEVLDASGKLLATRTLMHPHVDEQPFTRSLINVMLPDGTRQIFIRAHCSQGPWSKPTTEIDIAPK